MSPSAATLPPATGVGSTTSPHRPPSPTAPSTATPPATTAVACSAPTSVTLGNVTVAGNTASNDGGGVYVLSGVPTLTNATISGNSATSGGGLYLFFGVGATVTNTIVAGQANGGDTGGTGFAGGNNVIGVDAAAGAPGRLRRADSNHGPAPRQPRHRRGHRRGRHPHDRPARSAAVRPRRHRRLPEPALARRRYRRSAASAPTPATSACAEAVNLANVLSTADTISFDPSVFASAQVITLTAGVLVLTDSATTTILGPGGPVADSQRQPRQPGLRTSRAVRRRCRA